MNLWLAISLVLVVVTIYMLTIIQKGDTLTLFGPYQNIKALFQNESEEEQS